MYGAALLAVTCTADLATVGIDPQCFFGSRFSLDLTCDLAEGSPVEAFSTSPPSSRAISASRRLLTTERGFSVAMSLLDAKRSRCLMSSQDLSGLAPKPRVRTSTHEPRSFLP